MKVLLLCMVAFLVGAGIVGAQHSTGSIKVVFCDPDSSYPIDESTECLNVENTGSVEDLDRVVFQLPDTKEELDFFSDRQKGARGSFYGVSNDLRVFMSLVNVADSDDVVGSVIDTNTGNVHDIFRDGGGYQAVRTKHTSEFPPEEDSESPIILSRKIRNLRPPSPSTGVGRALHGHDGSIVDVMVVWTPDAECFQSGYAQGCTLTATTEANMRALVDLSVALSNTAYANSGIDTEMFLAHAYREPIYSEQGLTIDRDRLIDPSDGYFDDAHTLRATHCADAVLLILAPGDNCGLAAGIGETVDRMFAVVRVGCAAGNLSFPHELGHLQGCRHDRGTSNNCDVNAHPEYNYGYRDPEADFRTVMAYNCETDECDSNPSNSCARVPWFSNPTTMWGAPPNDKHVGDTNNDNARQINDTRGTVSAYLQGCDHHGTADVSVEGLVPSAVPAELEIGSSVDVSLTGHFRNNGPLTPTDVAVTITTASSTGIGVSPVSTSSTTAALAMGSIAETSETFTFTCTSPGLQDVSFTFETSATTGADPDPSNNSLTVSVSLNCILDVNDVPNECIGYKIKTDYHKAPDFIRREQAICKYDKETGQNWMLGLNSDGVLGLWNAPEGVATFAPVWTATDSTGNHVSGDELKLAVSDDLIGTLSLKIDGVTTSPWTIECPDVKTKKKGELKMEKKKHSAAKLYLGKVKMKPLLDKAGNLFVDYMCTLHN